MTPSVPQINPDRLHQRIADLAAVGAIDGGGCARLALTDADRAGRDLVCGSMRELGLAVSVDAIGNVVGVRAGRSDGPPVMTGSHIDTVRTGGRYDGNYGVLAGLEVVAALNDAGLTTEHPLAVAFFTNEEGARFAPDMMGSLVYTGALPLAEALAVQGIDGATVGDELARIGYAGPAPVPAAAPRAFVELHVEQGPVLDREGIDIGVVESVQGISWTEIDIRGTSNHAGTTPMSMRRDAGWAAGEIIAFVRELATELGGDQVATVGRIEFFPNLVNVVPNRAVLTVDLRNTDEALLQRAEARLAAHLAALRDAEKVEISTRKLARFAPVPFAPEMTDRIEGHARALGLTTRRMPSGAGHDAQMLAAVCPTAMIFVPSVDGISHNVREYTEPKHIEAGAQVLLAVLSELAGAGLPAGDRNP
ncbi:Zn-dependent hydrolase [Thauera sp. CAU 1555]|uniref:Zn-dependent hydrolase n=1 Tax=Thauera sedimentorum TaxID=2767595 RepID=A0ABR9BFH5_9RHOO|nr:Zn-dependent hydrolase [Thauera sedimentorum]MBC9073042.1 Zn-dependent hydrolase [Thauera sedimentorum]MBD8503961.1 Zn-dependent hydrolase [Thauera sedimentorum]